MSERPELSKRSPYWIGKHRYYELKHFCLQYPDWKKAYNSLNLIPVSIYEHLKKGENSDPTWDIVKRRLYYRDRIDIVEKTAMETSERLARYIVLGVTEGISYDILRARFDIPYSRSEYYDLYRRFFWLLGRNRG